MKHCTKCDNWKNESEFGKDRQTKDDLKCWCKECRNRLQRAFGKTEKGRAIDKRGKQTEQARKNARINNAQFRKTAKYKIIKRRYYHSEKGRAAANRALEKARLSEKFNARQAVGHAIEKGKLPPAKTQTCKMSDGSCEGRLEYHHYKGYAKKHWLDVIPLCRKHHYITETTD